MEQRKERIEPQTLEEYKKYVQDLKSKIRRYEKKTTELLSRLTERTKLDDREMKTKIIHNSVIFHRGITKIQAVWKGYRARKEFRILLKRYIATPVKTTSFRVLSNDTAIKTLNEEVKKLGT